MSAKKLLILYCSFLGNISVRTNIFVTNILDEKAVTKDNDNASTDYNSEYCPKKNGELR